MPSSSPLPSAGRRRALVAFVNTLIGVMGAGLAALLGVFALRPATAQASGRWIRAGTTDDLKPDVPVARVVSVPRADGWYRARARQTVFIVWDKRRSASFASCVCG